MDRTLLEQLTEPGARLPRLSSWLMDQVWTKAAFDRAGSPSAYLEAGEKLVCQRERILTAAAWSTYAELASDSGHERSVKAFLDQHANGAVVVLDGLSLRELPRLCELAAAAKRPVTEKSWSKSAIPSETEYFVSDRLGLGLPALAPSQLESRGELRDAGIRFYLFRNPNDRQTIESDRPLLWSRFPDQRFLDSQASGPDMYDSIWNMLEMVWQRTVQSIPPDRPVLVTSDHGYIYLGGGLDDPNLKEYERALDGKRCKTFGANEPLPEPSAGIWVNRKSRTAALTGRCHNRPQAPSASQSVYRHGGLSLMEVLTPWLVLGPQEA